MRQISLPGVDKAILSDTVGFVSDLPTQLVAAFKATLEEVVSADLLLHVRDIAHPDTEAQANDVEAVLTEIGVDDQTPRIEVWNKLDLLPDEREAAVARAGREGDVVAVSASDGEGIDALIAHLSTTLTAAHRRYDMTLDASGRCRRGMASRAWRGAGQRGGGDDDDLFGVACPMPITTGSTAATFDRLPQRFLCGEVERGEGVAGLGFHRPEPTFELAVRGA